jgi:hypothetical protein
MNRQREQKGQRLASALEQILSQQTNKLVTNYSIKSIIAHNPVISKEEK